MTNSYSQPETATGATMQAEITDPVGYGKHWRVSKRKVSDLLATGLPHFKIGKRRVRIVVREADAWMHEQFFVQRRAVPKNQSLSTTKDA